MLTTKNKTSTKVDVRTREDWNVKIARFFLSNSRITLLTFIIFTLLGAVSFFGLKTTGFPNPELKFAIIRTIYPQASAQTVLEQVTSPIETAIKSVQGIERYTSNSADSVSLVTVTIESKAKTDDVINKISTAIATAKLPTEVEKPIVQVPSVGGPDLIFTIFGDTPSKTYATQEAFLTKAKEIEQTNNVEVLNQITKVIEIAYNADELAQKGWTEQDLTNAISNSNQTLPVALNQLVDGKKVNIVTNVSARSVEDIKNITLKKQISPQSPAQENRIGEIAEVSEAYRQSRETVTGIRLEENTLIDQTITLNIKAKEGTDLGKYYKELHQKIKDIADTQIAEEAKVIKKEKPVILVENYSVNTQNQEQVAEIITGLIGGPFKIDNQILAQIGWIFGALQLVFLVMLVFVSWRAALIASISIPLSLLASMIYLYFTGNSLNTLVLFSLVLVIGLVVDPALVVLEAIQRKIDSGLKGKDAALEAVRDIGPGLFAATLTNAVVFIPLAIVSGTLGQIFSYIPTTILPALVGAYFIPLIFLTFIGASFLKRAKGKTDDEEKNLWPFAQWLIRLNTNILRSSAWLRLSIIVLITALSIFITGSLVGSGKITFTQFAASSDAQFLSLSITTPNNLTKLEKNTAYAETFNKVFKNENVVSIFPIQNQYLVTLKTKADGRSVKADSIAKSINNELQFLKPITDAKVEALQNGPPAGDYQVQLAVKTNSFEKGSATSEVLTQIIKSACVNDKREFLFENCENKSKVVEKTLDGYADFSQTTLKILLDANKLKEKGLTADSIPGALLVGGQLRNGFPSESTSPITTITKVDGTTIDVFIKKTNSPITTEENLRSYSLRNTRGEIIKLSDVSTIQQTVAQTAIGRVDGQTLTRYQIALKKEYSDQGTAARFETALLSYLKEGGKEKIEKNGIAAQDITTFTAGGTAEFAKSFSELGLALLLAIVIVYAILCIFMRSFSLPIVVLYTIPITFIGIFPALAAFTNGQFGFLEIIGLIILVGLVINAAIFLIDAARQKEEKGIDEKTAIALASGLRLRPVLLTKFTAIASLSPLIVTSEFYRNLALVIVSGIIVSGFLSLITTPILYIAFRRMSSYIKNIFRKRNKNA